MPARYDGSRLAKSRRTTQGYVRVDARLSRVGIQQYRRADGSTRRELRPAEEVFHADALAEPGVPVTIGHPALLTPANTRQHRVGGTVTSTRSDGGRFLAAEIQVEDADAIERIDRGDLVEISAGYTVELDETPGVYQGERYDAVQRRIRLNHLALLPVGGGRAGRDVGLRLDSADAVLDQDWLGQVNSGMAMIRLDGVEVEVSEPVAKAITEYQARLAKSERDLGAAEAKATAEKTRADAAEASVEPRAAERVALLEQARKVLGGSYDAAGKNVRAIHEDALRKLNPTAKFDGVSDERLAGRFEVAVEAAGPDASLAAAARATALAAPTARADAQETPEQAYAESVKAKGNLWQLNANARKETK